MSSRPSSFPILWSFKGEAMSLTMLQELIRFLASIGMVVVGSLFVLGVIYTGFERVVLRS